MVSLPSHATNAYFEANEVISFKALETDSQRFSDIVVKETQNYELNEILKTNMEPLSEKSFESSSVSVVKQRDNENAPRFKNYELNHTEHVDTKNDLLNTKSEDGDESVDSIRTDLNTAHLIQTLQGIQFVRALNTSMYTGMSKDVYLPPSKLFPDAESTKTLIFDLDETLIH